MDAFIGGIKEVLNPGFLGFLMGGLVVVLILIIMMRLCTWVAKKLGFLMGED